MSSRRLPGIKKGRKLFSMLARLVIQYTSFLIARYNEPPKRFTAQPQVRNRERFVNLRGTGKGLYGDVERYVDKLRSE